MNRQPIVAGQFYPGDSAALHKQVQDYIAHAKDPGDKPTILAMAPHAGYIFSGPVAGLTLGQANLSELVVLLGPNHTGSGAPLAVWPDGAWTFPGGSLPVQEDFVQAIISKFAGFTPDAAAHVNEHSLEVMLPFLHAVKPTARIVPIAVAERNMHTLTDAGKALAAVIREWPEPVSILVSSDMSHYISQDQAKEKDRLALDHIEQLDPDGLYHTVLNNRISMCGVFPMTLGLTAAKELGATQARLVAYDTSARASGDYAKVVGYAGVLAQ